MLESSCIMCPICRVDIRDSTKNTEVNDLCAVIIKHYGRSITESVNIDIRGDNDGDHEGDHYFESVIDHGPASLITNSNRRSHATSLTLCRHLYGGCIVVCLMVFSIIHIAFTSPQVHYYVPYNASSHIV